MVMANFEENEKIPLSRTWGAFPSLTDIHGVLIVLHSKLCPAEKLLVKQSGSGNLINSLGENMRKNNRILMAQNYMIYLPNKTG